MNIQGRITQLMTALRVNGIDIRINTYMFWSDKSNKYIKKYVVSKKEEYPLNDAITGKYLGKEEKYVKQLDTYNNLEILKYLVKEYKGSEGNEKTNGETA